MSTGVKIRAPRPVWTLKEECATAAKRGEAMKGCGAPLRVARLVHLFDMPDLWTRSDRDEIPEDVQAAMQRVHAEIAAIEAAGNEDACHVCGAGELTDEHTPSRRAGNNRPVFRGALDYDATVAAGEVAWTLEKLQRGATMQTVCGKCNNSSGRWYNPAYIRVSERCRPLATPENAGHICAVEFTGHPQRVAKQALTTLIATSQSGITATFPHLRQLLLDAEERGVLTPLRLGLFLRANDAGRTTGITGNVDRARRAGRLVAEFSFWPLGWVLTFDGQPFPGTVDVSNWTEYGFHERIDLAVDIPCQWAIGPYAGDFRRPEEIPVIRDYLGPA